MTMDVVSVNGARTDVLATLEDWLALDRDESDRPIIEVEVPQFGKKVFMRAMNQQARDEWELRYQADMQFAFTEEQAKERQAPRKTVKEVQMGMKSLLVSLCVVDQRGERIFSRESVDLLQRRNAAAINLLAEKADDLCGITQKDKEALERGKAAPSSNEAPAEEPPSV